MRKSTGLITSNRAPDENFYSNATPSGYEKETGGKHAKTRTLPDIDAWKYRQATSFARQRDIVEALLRPILICRCDINRTRAFVITMSGARRPPPQTTQCAAIPIPKRTSYGSPLHHD